MAERKMLLAGNAESYLCRCIVSLRHLTGTLQRKYFGAFMASHPVPPPSSDSLDEQPLSYEEGWALFDSLRGILKEDFAKLGGVKEYLRELHEDGDEDLDGK